MTSRPAVRVVDEALAATAPMPRVTTRGAHRHQVGPARVAARVALVVGMVLVLAAYVAPVVAAWPW